MKSDRPVLALAVLAMLAASCKEPAAQAATQLFKSDAKGVLLGEGAPQWKYVELALAAVREPLTPLPVPARVDLDEKRTTNVGVPLAGRVESVRVRLGSRVKVGDWLFSVRSAAFADLDREAEGARAQVGVKQRVVARLTELFELKAAAQKDVLTAEAELHEAQLALKAAESKQRSLQVDSQGDNLFWVKAARAGTVVDLDVYAGQQATPDRDKPLLRLSDLDEVLVIADLPQADVLDLAVGQAVTIRLATGGATREGVIEYISEVVDPRRRTVEVRARASNADRLLRPNSFVEVVVANDARHTVVRVADQAVVTQGSRSVIFVARGGGRLEPVTVVTGRRSGGETEIRSGLEAGTSYVSHGALLLLNQVQLSAEP
jgi:cobalt-zinc-cadmium efflux system membrane fusion protein